MTNLDRTPSWVDQNNAALLTDLYELTMAASYFKRDMNEPATFDLFVRDLPQRRNFLVVCGLEQALDYLESLTFDPGSLEYLESLGLFDAKFLEYLSRLSFSGDVWAMAEGEVAFAREPLISITAPLIEAQLVETFLLNCITFQTMVASKATRVAIASGDRSFMDFSLRRDHGADAGLKAARAAYIAGAASTSNVLAGRLFGIPVSGTMAHSYVMAFDTEAEAFGAFAEDFPERAVLLIDTFDILQGARSAVEVARDLAPKGVKLAGVRIDSGDLAGVTRDVRAILDDAGLEETKIILSGDLDEYRIAALCSDDVPVDLFGVGTQLGTSADSPYLGGVYKLVEDHRGPKIKLSTGKVTLPGRKQVHRFIDGGRIQHDVISLRDEEIDGSHPLMGQVMKGGERIDDRETLEQMQARCLGAVEKLSPELKALEAKSRYDVRLSEGLDALAEELTAQHRRPVQVRD